MQKEKPERRPRLTPRQKALERAMGTPLDETAEREKLGNTIVRLGKKWRGYKIKDVPLASLSYLAEKWEPSDFWEAETLKAIRKYIRLPGIAKLIEEEEGRRSYGRGREERGSDGRDFDWSS